MWFEADKNVVISSLHSKQWALELSESEIFQNSATGWVIMDENDLKSY